MTRHIYVDETKARGYVLAAVTVADPVGARKMVRGLVQSGNRRLHMHNERSARRPGIADAVVTADVDAVVYDAGRRYRTDRQARGACLSRLVQDLAAMSGDMRVVLELDETLVRYDQQCLIEAIRASRLRGHLRYDHMSAHAEPLLALPDVVAWCWVRSGVWRRRIDPILQAVRTV